MMTPPSTAEPARSRWQDQLKDAIRDVGELAALLDLPADALQAAGAPADFPLLVPRAFVARMRQGDPHDPLLRQVLPTAREAADVPGFTADPLAEAGFADGGLVRKYRGRSLLIATGACPVHCRYCFRRSFPYSEQLAARDGFEAAAAALETDGTEEAILSGGDPFTLSDRKLDALLARLGAVPTLKRIRIHTRFPIVLPDRVDAGLIRVLERHPLVRAIVLHSNHPRELDASVAAALASLRAAGVLLLNQAVLLRGVNDDADTLSALCERLFDCGVLPYYLHMLDPVAGAAHFDVDEGRARALHAQLLAKLPGYLVPRLVREIPGRASKTPIA